jgi:alpha-beta hydrolase superfamily lysophospholipase
MKHFEFERRTRDGLKLFFQGWETEGGSKAVVCLIHGFQEHSNRYEHVAAYLAKEGFALLTFDLRGHGKSQGKRGHIPSYEALLDDISILEEEARKRLPGNKIFLYGHSLGGNLALNYTLRRKPKIAGVISTSPWLKLAYTPSSLKINLAHIINKLIPKFSMPSGLKPKDLSRDSAVVRAYENDPFIHNRISLYMYLNIVEAGKWALNHANKFTLPILIMHGGSDRITSAEASRQFADRVSGNCTYKLWPGLYHEIHNEPEKEKVVSFLTSWLNDRISET